MEKLFENITKNNKEKICNFLETLICTFPKNTNVFSKIKSTIDLAYIEYGSIKIIKNDYNGNSTIVDTLYEGDIFGNLIFPISNDDYELIACEDTKIILFDYNLILNTSDVKYTYYNQFVRNLLKIMAKKIEENNDRLEILSKRSIRDKLLEYFKISRKKTGSKIIYLPISFTSLADYLVVDRSAMSREIKFLKDEGFIKVDNKKITILYW